MKKLIIGTFSLIILLSLVSCGSDDGYNLNAHLKKPTNCTVAGNEIVCPDGTRLQIPEPSGGRVLFSQAKVGEGECFEVYPGLFVENIKNGTLMDVYYNNLCKDDLGEYCDNVETSFGDSGTFGNNQYGAGEVCWGRDFHNGIQITGQRDLQDNSIIVNILDFN